MKNLNPSSMFRLPHPLLTAYLDTDSSKPDNQRRVPAYLTWLKAEAKSLLPNVPALERKLFLEQVDRVEKFLRDLPAHPKGWVIFAGVAAWQQVPLDLPVNSEMHWGRPALSQLLSIVDEQRPSCVVAVDLAGARLFRYELGEMKEFAEMKFSADTSQWKKKEHAHMARRGTRLPHGAQRDAFQRRMDAQYRRFYRALAAHIQALCERENLSWVFLVGSKRLTERIESVFSAKYRDRIVIIAKDIRKHSSTDMAHDLTPKIAAWTKSRTGALIGRLIAGVPGTVVGIDETLALIQQGAVSTALLADGLETTLHRCVQCGLTSRSADSVCPSCGGTRDAILLNEALPELARVNQTELELVRGTAARPLIASGGLGGWLRKPAREREAPAAGPRP